MRLSWVVALLSWGFLWSLEFSAAQGEAQLPGANSSVATVSDDADEGLDDDEEDEGEEDEEELTLSDASVSAYSSAGSSSTQLSGWVDVRPSWSAGESQFRAENEVGVGVQWSPGREAGYTQEFRSDWLAETDLTTAGFRFNLGDGYLWATVEEAVPLSVGVLNWEPRIYLPTSAPSRERGFLASTRQYLMWEGELGSRLECFLWEVPIVHFYSRPGQEEDGEFSANPGFENRVEAGVVLRFGGERGKLRLPVILQSLRLRGSAGGAEARWSHSLWVYPELSWKVGESLTLGAAYYSDALWAAGGEVGDLNSGFSKGVAQAVLGYAF